MREGEALRPLGALLVMIGLGLSILQSSSYVSLAGLLLGAASLLLLLRGRPARLLRPAAIALVAVTLQALGSPTSLALLAGTALLLWANREELGLRRRPGRQRRWVLVGLTVVLIGLFLPWEGEQGRFAGGFTHQLAPLTGRPVSTYDPLAVWLVAEQLPGRQLLGALLPLLAWGALLLLALDGRKRLQRLGPPLLIGLLVWWVLQRSILLGGLLYLTGVGLSGLGLLWEGQPASQGKARRNPTTAPGVPGPGPRPGRSRPPARRGGAPS